MSNHPFPNTQAEALAAPQPSVVARAPSRGTWFPISALTRDSFPVRILIPGGEVTAFRKTFRRPREVVWSVPIRDGSGRFETRRKRCEVIWCVRREDGSTSDLPPHAYPTLFRPVNLSRFPDPLPAPATIQQPVAWGSEHPETVPLDPEDALEWRGAYHEPGEIGRREAEVRVLRALKTMASRDVGAGDRERGGDTDSLLRLMLRAIGRIEYEFKDATDVKAIALRWLPTARDVGDWSTAVGWWSALPGRREKDAVWFRSVSPPFSFRQIGEQFKVSRQAATEVYKSAIDGVWEAANGGK